MPKTTPLELVRFPFSLHRAELRLQKHAPKDAPLDTVARTSKVSYTSPCDESAEHKITVIAYTLGIVGTAMWELIEEKLAIRGG